MDGTDIVRIIGITMALLLAISAYKARRIGLGDGVKMAAMWAFLIIAAALVFTVIGR